MNLYSLSPLVAFARELIVTFFTELFPFAENACGVTERLNSVLLVSSLNSLVEQVAVFPASSITSSS